MKQNNISPLEVLRQEKEILRQECAESEEVLADYWSYVNNNIGSLLLNSAINSTRRRLGFGGSSQSHKKGNDVESNGLAKGMLSGVVTAMPWLWEILQPMLMSFAMSKVKSFFTGGSKKKKKKSSNND